MSPWDVSSDSDASASDEGGGGNTHTRSRSRSPAFHSSSTRGEPQQHRLGAPSTSAEEASAATAAAPVTAGSSATVNNNYSGDSQDTNASTLQAGGSSTDSTSEASASQEPEPPLQEQVEQVPELLGAGWWQQPVLAASKQALEGQGLPTQPTRALTAELFCAGAGGEHHVAKARYCDHWCAI